MDSTVKAEVIGALKSQGLEVAEDVAVQLVKASFAIVTLLLPKVSKVMAPILVPAINLMQPKVLELVDLIDGKDNPDY